MPPLTDPVRLNAYKDALSNWRIDGYIQFRLTAQAFQWVQDNLGEISLNEIGRLMHEYIAAGGLIHEVPERRPEWSGRYEFHYDLKFVVNDTSVYIETRLNLRLPFVQDESSIRVVNIHAP